MFKIGGNKKSIYTLVEEKFLSPENLQYLQTLTDKPAKPSSYAQFINSNLVSVSITKSVDENVRMLNTMVAGRTLHGKHRTVLQHIMDKFMSRQNITDMGLLFGDVERVAEEMYKFKSIAYNIDETDLSSIEEGLELMNKKFARQYAKRSVTYGVCTGGDNAACEENYADQFLHDNYLSPAGYEGLNREDPDDPVMERSMYKVQRDMDADPTYTTAGRRLQNMPAYGSIEYLQRQRKPEIPQWQTTDRKIFRDIDDSLGQSELELGAVIRKQKKHPIRKSYPITFASK